MTGMFDAVAEIRAGLLIGYTHTENRRNYMGIHIDKVCGKNAM